MPTLKGLLKLWLRYLLIKPFGIVFFKLKRYRLEFSGRDNIPQNGPFILVMNHQSEFDIFAVGLGLGKTMDKTRVVPWAKVEIGKGKEGNLGMFIYHYLGAIPIDRNDPDSREAIERSLKYLKKGDIVAIFPEGSRRKDGELGAFKYGVANLARAVPVPILPVGVHRLNGAKGIQINFGRAFFMPATRKRMEIIEGLEERFEDRFKRNVESLRNWSEDLCMDKKTMRFIKRSVRLVMDFIKRQNISLEKYAKLAELEDNEFIREKVFELLPDNWVKLPVE